MSDNLVKCIDSYILPQNVERAIAEMVPSLVEITWESDLRFGHGRWVGDRFFGDKCDHCLRVKRAIVCRWGGVRRL